MKKLICFLFLYLICYLPVFAIDNNSNYLTYSPLTEITTMEQSLASREKELNIYINYADYIVTNNINLFFRIFDIKQDDIKKALIEAKQSNDKQIKDLLQNRNKINNNIKSTISTDSYFNKYSLENINLIIYYLINKNKINKQISEFNEQKQKQVAIFTYNTKIASNVYFYAYLKSFSLKRDNYDPYTENFLYQTYNNVASEVKYMSDINNILYKDFLSMLKENNIKLKKPKLLTNKTIDILTLNKNNEKLSLSSIYELLYKNGYNEAALKNIEKIFDNNKNIKYAQKLIQEAKTPEQLRIANWIYNGLIDVQNPPEITTFFNGIPYNASMLDVLNSFNKIPSVKSIKIVSNKSVPVLLLFNNAATISYSKNLKNNISKQTLSTIFNNWTYANRYAWNYKNIVKLDGNISKLRDDDIAVYIDSVVINNLPYKVTLFFGPSVGLYYKHPEKSFKTNNAIYSYYLKEICLETPQNANIAQIIESNNYQYVKEVVNLYREKYKRKQEYIRERHPIGLLALQQVETSFDGKNNLYQIVGSKITIVVGPIKKEGKFLISYISYSINDTDEYDKMDKEYKSFEENYYRNKAKQKNYKNNMNNKI